MNEFETAVVNEPSVFEPLKFYCIKKFLHYSGLGKPKMLFFLLINVKMPTIVGILTFLSRKNFMFS